MFISATDFIMQCTSFHAVAICTRSRLGLARVAAAWLALAMWSLPVAAGSAYESQNAAYQPHVAIIMCDGTYAEDWEAAHMSSQALVGLAGLIGVPYDTLLLSELLATPDAGYTSIWFAKCQYVAPTRMHGLASFLDSYMAGGGTVLLDGPLEDRSGSAQNRIARDLESILGVAAGGWDDVQGHAVYTTDAAHPIARHAGYAPLAQLTQGVADGTEIVELVDDGAPGSAVLLELVPTDRGRRHPYLVVAEPPGGGRVAGISGYGGYLGAASCFRNDRPSGFFDNQLLPYLIETALWLVGPADEPFVGLQLSHAPVTAIGRLDGDWSDEREATRRTFEYLVDMARASGIATAYGIVSEFAPASGWDLFRELGWQLEAVGGAIGSHSASHPYDMSETLTPPDWTREIVDSLRVIRGALTDAGFAPAVDVFINPGNTIRVGDYGRFFADISLYLSHGFEVFTPYSSGVMGFGLPAGVPPRPVVNNTPVPDFQWLYLDGWVYTVDQAADFQSRILGYYQDTVGRGVLYNQMWHDYAIGGDEEPVHFPDTDSRRPLFDANRVHFVGERVYAPSIRELTGKMHLAHGVRLSSRVDGDHLIARLDFSAVQGHLAHVAGMGLRVNHAERPIAAVTVNGAPHAGFSADTVILPPAREPVLEITIDLGPAGSRAAPRLTYLSKPLAGVLQEGDALEVALAQPGQHTKFCVEAPARTVVLHADTYTRQRQDTNADTGTGAGRFCGHLRQGSAASVLMTQELDTGVYALQLAAAERGIEHVTRTATGVQLAVAAGDAGVLTFESAAAPVAVTVDGMAIEPMALSDGALGFALEIPASAQGSVVEVVLSDCADEDADGATVCAGDCDDGDPARTGPCPAEPPNSPAPPDGDGMDMPPAAPGGCGCQAGGSERGGAASVLLIGLAVLWARRRESLRTGR